MCFVVVVVVATAVAAAAIAVLFLLFRTQLLVLLSSLILYSAPFCSLIETHSVSSYFSPVL